MSSNPERKTRTIRFVINDNTSPFSQGLIDHLKGVHGLTSDIHQRIGRAVEAFYLPFAVPPDHEQYRFLVLECLSSLQAHIELIEHHTGISIERPHKTTQSVMESSSVPTVGQSQNSKLPIISKEALTPEPTPIEELKATIDKFVLDLAAGVEPMSLLNSLNQLQPENEAEWSADMWLIYDEFHETLSKANYEVTLNPNDNW